MNGSMFFPLDTHATFFLLCALCVKGPRVVSSTYFGAKIERNLSMKHSSQQVCLLVKNTRSLKVGTHEGTSCRDKSPEEFT